MNWSDTKDYLKKGIAILGVVLAGMEAYEAFIGHLEENDTFPPIED